MSDHRSERAIRLAALDFAYHPLETIELAQELERAGYHRLWLAEHPPQEFPEILVGMMALKTSTIRVGTAGILLSFRNAYQSAQNFLSLASMFPDRIDAGFCAGGAPTAALGLALTEGAGTTEEMYLTRARNMVGLIREDLPQSHPLSGIPFRRRPARPPEIWVLGGGPSSSRLAAELGVNYGYSLFITGSRDDPAAVNTYREDFWVSHDGASPCVSVAVAGVCAETASEAQSLAAEHDNSFVRLELVGTPEQWRRHLEQLWQRYQMDEVVFIDVCRRLEDRIRSYRLLADVLK